VVEQGLEEELADRDGPLLPRLARTLYASPLGTIRLARRVPRPSDVEVRRVGQELDVAPPESQCLANPKAPEEECP
jgi:hypothetical protein